MDLCPRCGTDEPEVLRETPQRLTLSCSECAHVWNTTPPRQRMRDVALIISAGDRSYPERIEIFRDDEIAVGDEFEHNGHRMMVTAIEVDGARHETKAVGDSVRTLHAKLFDAVVLKLSINENDVTRSYQMEVEPELEVAIGDVLEVEGRRLAVKTLKSDQNRTLHRGFLLARNVRRAFCDPAPEDRRKGDRISTRRRGLPPGMKRKRSHRR